VVFHGLSIEDRAFFPRTGFAIQADAARAAIRGC
jgi:hypothetical protein